MTRLALLAAAILLPVVGARAESLWVGNAFVVAATGTCGTSAKIGDAFRAIYRPKGAGLGNGADSRLALFTTRSSFALIVPNNTFRPSINYGAQTVGSTLSVGKHTGGILAWQESFSSGVTYVRITTSLAKFFGISQCTATLEMHLTLLPAS